MESNQFTTIFIPVALAAIMLGLGLSLKIEDCRRVIVYPKAVLVALACQMLLLPAICVAIASMFGLRPELAVGLMLLAASPGGATANLFSHLAKGDVALNVTLTAVNSLLSLFTMPLIINWSMLHFSGQQQMIPLQFDKIIQVFAIVLVPVGIGMAINARFAEKASALRKYVKVLSSIFLILVVAAAIAKERNNLVEFIEQVGLAALTFNLVSLLVGYFGPILMRLPKRQAIAISMEVGIHNSTLAIAIASSPTLLNNSMMAIPPAVYSLIMLITATIFAFLVNRGRDNASEEHEAA